MHAQLSLMFVLFAVALTSDVYNNTAIRNERFTLDERLNRFSSPDLTIQRLFQAFSSRHIIQITARRVCSP